MYTILLVYVLGLVLSVSIEIEEVSVPIKGHFCWTEIQRSLQTHRPRINQLATVWSPEFG